VAKRDSAPTTGDDLEQESSESEDERYVIKPEVWESLMDALPPWFDEISAIVLLVFGAISMMALFDISADAPLANAWSGALTTLFGYGSIIIPVGIFALGVIILLPKLGIVVRFPARRILALEVAFLAVLALMHVLGGGSEMRAAARAGEGGGYIGWGVSMPLVTLFGPVVTLVFYGALLAISLAFVFGVRRAHIFTVLQRASETLHSFGSQTIETTRREKTIKHYAGTGEVRPRPSLNLDKPAPNRRAQVMRIRPDPDSLPPSQRPGAAAPPSSTTTPEPELDEEDLERLGKVLASSAAPPAYAGEIKTDFNVIGELLPKKGKKPQMVKRPDGRVKRYFTVESMREQRKVGRRDKALPPLDLLEDVEINLPDDDEINRNVVLIENTLLEFDISVDVVDVKVGPTVTQYAVQPFREVKGADGEMTRQGTRLSKIAALSNDLALTLSAKRLRLETPVPGHSYMGVEVPNKNPSIVALRPVYESKGYYERLQKSSSPLLVPLGRDVSGLPVAVDLATMPHLLIAGTTGSGKSVCIAALATALILHNKPDAVKLIMLDPKMVELSRFNSLPHLLGPVETDQERIIGVLRWCTREMDRRYKLLEEHAARNIQIYNSQLGQRRKSEHLPYIVIMVDEIGDLMMSKPEETEKTITRLAQMARAVGMHLVVATQRPSVDVITGLIKANFPARISFAVPSGVDSRVILDSGGAEALLGQGDMLYLAPDAAAPKRVQGCFVSDTEVRAVIKHWQDWHKAEVEAGRADPLRPGIGPWERGLTRREFLAETDPMLEDAIELVVEEQEASASMIQRRLGLGYPRAARIVDLLEELGVIGEPIAGGRSRKVLIERGKDPFRELLERRSRPGK
jgi:DNA segregation ATPase FtsK/SpoIIIE, S-DNA-T family